MTIEEVMALALKLTQAQMSVSRYGADEAEVIEAENNLRDAILALVDENTRACAEVCEVAFDDLAIAIRARIAARKGGTKP